MQIETLTKPISDSVDYIFRDFKGTVVEPAMAEDGAELGFGASWLSGSIAI